MSTSSHGSFDTHPESVAWACFFDDPSTKARLDDLAWIDLAMLEDLEEQMGSRDIAWRFARDYAELWPKRQSTLVAAFKRQDFDAALDAALSLKNSSAMVGGVRLARAAQALEVAIRTGAGLDRARSILGAVAVYGRATVNELQQTYPRRGGSSGPYPVRG
jgi:HPt (histidine-containing phosphotransfer) domain-containing protein